MPMLSTTFSSTINKEIELLQKPDMILENVRNQTSTTHNGERIGGKLFNLQNTTSSNIITTAWMIRIKIFLCMVLATGMITIKTKTFRNLM